MFTYLNCSWEAALLPIVVRWLSEGTVPALMAIVRLTSIGSIAADGLLVVNLGWTSTGYRITLTQITNN